MQSRNIILRFETDYDFIEDSKQIKTLSFDQSAIELDLSSKKVEFFFLIFVQDKWCI